MRKKFRRRAHAQEKIELKQLRVLRDSLLDRLDSFPVEAIGALVFYHHDGNWFRLDTEEGAEISSAEKQVLEAVKTNATGVQRPRSSKFVYFWIQEREAVVRLEFRIGIKTAAQEKCKKALGRLNTDARNFYHATHDALTGLKNRSAFEQHLADAVKQQRLELSRMRGTSAGMANSSSSITSTFLLALDLDNFKTINDRFGHGYGDLVLASLGWRLERVALDFEQRASSRLSIQVYRLGGEEFEVLAYGSTTEKEILDLAEQIRISIGTRSLPSDEEFQALQSRDFYDGSELVVESMRNVTVSIGLAMINKVALDDPTREASAMAGLKRQADIALSSAKLGGKDRVRNFSEILSEYGRISGVDAANGVVSIDIGKEVGVKSGQEFFVYSPGYDGSTDYFLGEGRSRKRVGVFPKFKAGRLAVFNVQNEVSFCRIEALEKGVAAIQPGSSLEAIPLGSIAHIVTKGVGSQRLAGRETLVAKVGELSSGGVVLNATLRRIEDVSEQFGMARANALLALIGEKTISSVGKSGVFGQLAVGSITAAIACESEEQAESIAGSAFESISSIEYPPGVEVGLGWVFVPSEGQPVGLREGATADDIVDASILASTYDEFIDASRNCRFDAHTLWYALYLSRVAGQYDRMTADYDRFEKITPPSQWVYNQMALMYADNDEMDRAIEFMVKAIGVAPTSEVTRVNYAGMLVMGGRYQAALDAFHPELLGDEQAQLAYLFAKLKVDPIGFGEYVRDRAGQISVPAISSWLTSQELLELKKGVRDNL